MAHEDRPSHWALYLCPFHRGHSAGLGGERFGPSTRRGSDRSGTQAQSVCLWARLSLPPRTSRSSILVPALAPCLNGCFYPPRNCASGCSFCGASFWGVGGGRECACVCSASVVRVCMAGPGVRPDRPSSSPGPCEGLCVPVTVLLSLAGASVSAGAEGAGFGPVVGNYLCDTQACALGCPGEQSPWSDGNNHLLCARVCGRAAEKAELGWGQLRPWWLRMPCSRFSP